MMGRPLHIGGWVAAAVVLCLAIGWPRNHTSPPSSPGAMTTSAGPRLEQIRELSALTTLRIEVADAQLTELSGYTGSVRAALVVRGDVSLGVDLEQARFESVEQDNRRVTLILPQPMIQLARVDHERTRLIGMWQSGLWQITPGGSVADVASVNHAYQEAQRIVASVAADPKLLGRARKQAELVLERFGAALGWTMEVRWNRTP